ncbi:MAG: type IV pilin protein [Moraxellaceae bacterium]
MIRIEKQLGFTLIELMVVLAIVAMISAIAMPSYKSSVRKSNRTSVQGDLQGAAAGMALYRAQNFTYTGAALSGTGGVFPSPSASNYDLALTVGTTGQTFVITATPKAGKTQVGTGALAINQAGERCWNKSSDVACTPGTTGQEWQ